MPQELLDEREFELVNIVGAQLAVNQRDLSRQMKLSLGMTNLILRRLISKGYIRIQQLNQRKVQYLLTPKGFSEKMRKSLKYTLKTINSISLIKLSLQRMVGEFYQNGQREFWIIGTSDLAQLIEVVVKESGWGDCRFHYIHQWADQVHEGVIFICKEDVVLQGNGSLKVVHVIHELSKTDLLLEKAGDKV
jgi:DNA-binding MarR family transcriptional regulator